jgi:hypothetical protein
LSSEALQAMNSLSSVFTQFVQRSDSFNTAAQSLSQTFIVFAGTAQDLTKALTAMPRELSGSFNHQVTVVHNGTEAFAKLTPYIQETVKDAVNAALSRAFKEHLPDAGVTIE